jgi:hypothetical protein
MSADIERRWDIYLNGRDGVKQLTINSLCAWRVISPVCGRFANALVEFLTATLILAGILVLPFAFWLAPFVAIFSARRVVSEDEIRARMRKDIHCNGRSE